MLITRYARRPQFSSPWKDLENVTSRFNHLFGEPANGETSRRAPWSPAVNVEESKDGLSLSAELPGMNLEDIEIEVENNVLTLRGEKKEEKEEGDERRYHLWERRYGSFERSFTLPRTVKSDGITARFKDGILQVTMPKAPEAKSRRIEVKTEG